MHPDAQAVLDALRALCARAGTHPEDDTEAAGRLVCAALDREVNRDPGGSVLHCPLNALVRELAGVSHALVTADRVILPHVKTERLPIVRGRDKRAGYGRAWVALPAAIKQAVALFDAHKWQLRGAA